jgi:hypothetical protein
MDKKDLIAIFESIKQELINFSKDKKYTSEYQEGMLSAYNTTIGILKSIPNDKIK